jgi:uncharacterized phage protein (TIGR02220 family)
VSFAFLPWYTGDYLRDTRHLSPLKHGVYLLLLAYCWDQKGPLPLDEQECAGICNCRSQDEIEALRYVLVRFFVKMADGWYNRRIQLEIERANAISAKRKYAGKLGYQAKAKHLPSKSRASAQQVPLPPPPQPPLQLESTTTSGKPDTRPPFKEQAREVLAFLNEKTGRHYQAVRANLEMIEARLKDGATIDELRAVVAKKCREWTGNEKMAPYLRPATLFNRTKFAQYQGELHAVS